MPQIKFINNQSILYIRDEQNSIKNQPVNDNLILRGINAARKIFLDYVKPAPPSITTSNNKIEEKITPKTTTKSEEQKKQKQEPNRTQRVRIEKTNDRKDSQPILEKDDSTTVSINPTTTTTTTTTDTNKIPDQKNLEKKDLERVSERSSVREDLNAVSDGLGGNGNSYENGNTYGVGFYSNVSPVSDSDNIEGSKQSFLAQSENTPSLEQGEIRSGFKDKPEKELDFKKEAGKIKEKLKKKNPLLNIDNPLVYNKKPLFIKSYSAFDFLTPYIRCYIVIKDFKNDFINKNDLTKTFFDIPYNMIESFSIEYETQSAINGKIRLVLNDTTGIIGNIFTSMLYTLGYNADIFNAVPKINIEFGYAKKGLKKLSKREQKKVLYKNFFSEFLILNTDMIYDDKFKQQIVLTGYQEKTGISGVLNTPNTNFSPHKILGEYPTETLKLLIYHRLLKTDKIKNDDIIKDVFGQKNLNTNNPEYQKLFKIIEDFKNCIPMNPNDTLSNDLKDVFKKNDFSAFLKPNVFFNSFDNANLFNSDRIKNFKLAANTHLKNQVFSPMLLFSFILNIYINKIIKEEAKLNSYILTLFDLQAVKWGIVTSGADTLEALQTFTELCYLDHLSSKDNKKSKTDCYLNSNTFQISSNTTWDNLLTNLIDKITLAKEKPPVTLYMNHSKFINSSSKTQNIEFDQQFEEKKFGYTGESSSELIKKIDIIIEKLKDNILKKDNSTNAQQIETVITGLKSQKEKIEEFISKGQQKKKDFVFFVISPGANFITPENFSSFFILQHYTVFPKIKTSREISYQNFNSGKNKLYDESFPDVISFQPKINFQNVISSHINHISDIELKNGILSVSDETLSMKFEDSSKDIIGDVKKLTKDLDQITSDVNSDSTVSIVTDSNNSGYFIINRHSNILLSGSIVSNLNSFISNRRSAGSITKADKVSFNGDVYKNIIVRINNLKMEIERKIRRIGYGYHFNELNNIFKKSLNVLPGDNNTAEFYNYQNLSNRYNLDLSVSATNFEAELKILGEPAFTFDFFPFCNILIRVNNFDGSRNDFLSGVYRIIKMRHEIDKGNFFTILSLQYTLENYVGHKGKIE